MHTQTSTILIKKVCVLSELASCSQMGTLSKYDG